MPYILASASKPHMSLTEESPEPELLVDRELGGQFPSRSGKSVLRVIDMVEGEVTICVLPGVAVGFVVGFVAHVVCEDSVHDEQVPKDVVRR